MIIGIISIGCAFCIVASCSVLYSLLNSGLSPTFPLFSFTQQNRSAVFIRQVLVYRSTVQGACMYYNIPLSYSN